jgi:hypothetical protein
LKQSAGGKMKENKEYFWACHGPDDRNTYPYIYLYACFEILLKFARRWMTILQEYGAVCLDNPNAVTLKLRKMVRMQEIGLCS